MSFNTDQHKLFDELEKQHQHQRQMDRVLAIVFPIIAFLLTVICANMNIWSTVCTYILLWVAFWAVGIRRLPLWLGVLFAGVFVAVAGGVAVFAANKTAAVSGGAS